MAPQELCYGDIITCIWGGVHYKAEIKSVRGRNLYVHYIDYSKRWNEWIGPKSVIKGNVVICVPKAVTVRKIFTKKLPPRPLKFIPPWPKPWNFIPPRSRPSPEHEMPYLLDPIPSTSSTSASTFAPRRYATSKDKEGECSRIGASNHKTLGDTPPQNPRYKSYEEVNIGTRVKNLVETMREDMAHLGHLDGDFENSFDISSASSNFSDADDAAFSDSGIDNNESTDNDSVLNPVADPKNFFIRGGPPYTKFIKIKGVLSIMLLYDYKKIIMQHKLPWLPNVAPMEIIFNNWRKHNTDRIPAIMDTMIQILTSHFNNNIAGGGLLFPYERKNHREILKQYRRKPMTQVYGGVYFIRLCDMLNRAMSKLDFGLISNLFISEVQSMVNFVEEHHVVYLSKHEYKDPPPGYGTGFDADDAALI